MARFHNAHRGKQVRFKVGDSVWLDARHIKTNRPSKKLDDKWFGPFPIIEVISDNAYKLKMTPPFSRLHPVFNLTMLRKFNPDEIEHRPKPHHPDPILNEQGEQVYAVEKILDSRLHRGRIEYLVNWEGFGPEHNSWEPSKNLEGAQRMVREFHRNNPDRPNRISSMTWKHFPYHRYMSPSSNQQLFNWRP